MEKIIKKNSIHKWLDRKFGKPKFCEHCERNDRKKYEWANIKNHKYRKIRKDFIRLCTSCHRKYDLTKVKRETAIKNLWWSNGKKMRKPILKYNKNGKLLKRYSSITEAAMELNVLKSTIINNLKGRYNNKNYVWKYE
jgi:hypothetical protein